MSVFEDIKLGLEQAIEYEKQQKQIEEIAEILCQSKEHNCNGEDCKCLKQATDLFDKGARILPKDSVVLSREEWEKLDSVYKMSPEEYIAYIKENERLKEDIQALLEARFERFNLIPKEESEKQVDKVSKEKVEKFAEEVNSLLYERDCLREDVKRIAKQFGSEILGGKDERK